MSTLVGSPESRAIWNPPEAKPLDEAVWRAWLANGRALDARSTHARLEAIKMIMIAGLLAAAALWPYLSPYEIAVRFIVTGAAIFVMLHAILARRYAFAAAFGALAVLYNPVVPLFHASDDLQRVLLAASAIPFIASLGWRKSRLRTP